MCNNKTYENRHKDIVHSHVCRKYLENGMSVLFLLVGVRHDVSSRPHAQTFDRILNHVWNVGGFFNGQQVKYLKRKGIFQSYNPTNVCFSRKIWIGELSLSKQGFHPEGTLHIVTYVIITISIFKMHAGQLVEWMQMDSRGSTPAATFSASRVFPGSLMRTLWSTALTPHSESGWAVTCRMASSPGTAEDGENSRDTWDRRVNIQRCCESRCSPWQHSSTTIDFKRYLLHCCSHLSGYLQKTQNSNDEEMKDCMFMDIEE